MTDLADVVILIHVAFKKLAGVEEEAANRNQATHECKDLLVKIQSTQVVLFTPIGLTYEGLKDAR